MVFPMKYCPHPCEIWVRKFCCKTRINYRLVMKTRLIPKLVSKMTQWKSTYLLHLTFDRQYLDYELNWTGSPTKSCLMNLEGIKISLELKYAYFEATLNWVLNNHYPQRKTSQQSCKNSWGSEASGAESTHFQFSIPFLIYAILSWAMTNHYHVYA